MKLIIKTAVVGMIFSLIFMAWIVLDTIGIISHDYAIWTFPIFIGMMIFLYWTLGLLLDERIKLSP